MAKIFSLLILTGVVMADSWHSALTHRPRTVLLAEEVEATQARLANPPFSVLWNNDYGSYTGIYTYARKAVEASDNTVSNPRASLDERSRVAKNAAFVYLMNRDASGTAVLDSTTDDNNPWTRDEYLVHAVNYLESLDPTVNGPSGLLDLEDELPLVNNWQHRDRELIYYCQAYDMLLGAGMDQNITIENNLADFANNFITRYSASVYVHKYALQRNNHKIMLGSALGVAAVTLNHHDDAGDWANAAMIIINWVLFSEPAEGFDGINLVDNDGGFAEGPDYAKYSWSTLVPFIMSMRNFNGDWTETYETNIYPGNEYGSANNLALQSPYYDPRYTMIYDYLTTIVMPGGRMPGIEDASLTVYIPEIGILGSAYAWEITSPDSAYSDERFLNAKLGALQADFIAAGNAPGHVDVIMSSPGMVVKPDAGSAVIRTHNADGSAGMYMYLNAKNGLTRQAAAAHDQADVNHFTVGVMDELMVFDAGYPGYDDRYHANKSEHHNTILVNGYGAHPPSGPTYSLTITTIPPSFDFTYSAGDASPVDGFFEDEYHDELYDFVQIYSNYGQAYVQHTDLEEIEGQEVWAYDETDSTNMDLERAVLSVKGAGKDYIVMMDQITSASANEYRWLMHTNSGGNTGGSFAANDHGGVITRGDAQLEVYMATNDGETIAVETGNHYSGHGLDNLEEHTLLTSTKSGSDSYFLTIFMPLYGTDNAPSFEAITGLPAGVTGLIATPGSPGNQSTHDIILAQSGNNELSVNYENTHLIETSANFIVINVSSSGDSDFAVNRIHGSGPGGNLGSTVTIDGVIYNMIYDPDVEMNVDLVVNEFLANSENCCADQSGEQEDFIELYNISDEAIDIGGWFMTDNLEEPLQWRVPDSDGAVTTIEPGGFLTIFADNDVDQGVLHANFTLSTDGEEIGLFAYNGAQVLSLNFEAQLEDTSYGQYPDGSGNWQQMNPTPGSSNIEELTTENLEQLPAVFSLHQNYPNPFNPVTRINYDLPENVQVTIKVYDLLGRNISTLLNKHQEAGYRSIVWDGRDDGGNSVAAGIYLFQIQAGDFIQSKKMVLLK